VAFVEVEQRHKENKLLIRAFVRPIRENVPANRVFLDVEPEPVEVLI